MDVSYQPSPYPGYTVPEGHWYAIQTAPRHEKSVTKQLRGDGIETFLPLTREVRQWSDRKQKIELPLFPGYVFLHLKDYASDRIQVLRKFGVVRFIGNQSGALPIPEPEIASVRQLLKNEIACKEHPYLKSGQRVRIRDGALRGIEGILLRVANDHTLILSVELIQKSLAIQLQGYEVEVI
jgi:transcription antitermination factor NusG